MSDASVNQPVNKTTQPEGLVTTLVQQDSAPAHRAAHVQLLNQETPNFLAPNLCPPKSPDLSPVDYEIWGVTQHRALPQTNP